MTTHINRAQIEDRAAVMAQAMAVEDPEVAELRADTARWLTLLHGIRFTPGGDQ